MISRPQRKPSQPSVANYQTIKLARGKHSSPDHGACVMELASMLAGERFTDRPSSVCPVLGSFLRMYNDSIDNERRQDLYEYASKIVGSRATEDVRLARADRLARWAFELRQQRRIPLLRRLHERRGINYTPTVTSIGRHAVTAIRKHTDHTHAAALALIDELIEMGGSQRSWEMRAAQKRQALVRT